MGRWCPSVSSGKFAPSISYLLHNHTIQQQYATSGVSELQALIFQRDGPQSCDTANPSRSTLQNAATCSFFGTSSVEIQFVSCAACHRNNKYSLQGTYTSQIHWWHIGAHSHNHINTSKSKCKTLLPSHMTITQTCAMEPQISCTRWPYSGILSTANTAGYRALRAQL